MCHRYNVNTPAGQIADFLEADLDPLFADLSADAFTKDRYPTNDVPVVTLSEGKRLLQPMSYGLLPSWWKPSGKSKSPHAFQRKCFNARSESAHEKPSFRSAFKSRRALIPANAFYEKGHWFTLKDEPLMVFAGLYEIWQDELRTCTILTTESNDIVKSVGHPRMPVILDQVHWSLWLDPDIRSRQPLEHLLVPKDSDAMECHVVDE